jgi:hypothetical protein
MLLRQRAWAATKRSDFVFSSYKHAHAREPTVHFRSKQYFRKYCNIVQQEYIYSVSDCLIRFLAHNARITGQILRVNCTASDVGQNKVLVFCLRV